MTAATYQDVCIAYKLKMSQTEDVVRSVPDQVLPFVALAKASAVPCPMPEVPPTNRATGRYVAENAALDARAALRVTILWNKMCVTLVRV